MGVVFGFPLSFIYRRMAFELGGHRSSYTH